MCDDEKNVGKCKNEGNVYELKCNQCGMCYVGETSRSMFERKAEHDEGEMNEHDNNALWKHDMKEHEGVKQDYKVKILRREKNPLKRQVAEKVEIEKRMTIGPLMNSKNDSHKC